MSELDLIVRENLGIPDDADTEEWCSQNGYDYRTELIGAYISTV